MSFLGDDSMFLVKFDTEKPNKREFILAEIVARMGHGY